MVTILKVLNYDLTLLTIDNFFLQITHYYRRIMDKI